MRIDARAVPIRLITQLLLVVSVLLCVALVASASGGASPVAHGAKKCKKHKLYATAAKKKCKKKKPAASQPVAPAGPAPASLSISPTSHDFGTVIDPPEPGSDSPTQTFTVTNTGGSASGIMTTALAGTDAANFVKTADTCDGAGLGAGSTCAVDLHCTALGLQVPKSATLTVTAYPGGYPSATLTCSYSS